MHVMTPVAREECSCIGVLTVGIGLVAVLCCASVDTYELHANGDLFYTKVSGYHGNAWSFLPLLRVIVARAS